MLAPNDVDVPRLRLAEILSASSAASPTSSASSPQSTSSASSAKNPFSGVRDLFRKKQTSPATSLPSSPKVSANSKCDSPKIEIANNDNKIQDNTNNNDNKIHDNKIHDNNNTCELARESSQPAVVPHNDIFADIIGTCEEMSIDRKIKHLLRKIYDVELAQPLPKTIKVKNPFVRFYEKELLGRTIPYIERHAIESTMLPFGRTCASCDMLTPDVTYRCLRCDVIPYCSTLCQIQDSKNHAFICQKLIRQKIPATVRTFMIDTANDLLIRFIIKSLYCEFEEIRDAAKTIVCDCYPEDETVNITIVDTSLDAGHDRIAVIFSSLTRFGNSSWQIAHMPIHTFGAEVKIRGLVRNLFLSGLVGIKIHTCRRYVEFYRRITRKKIAGNN
jgi:hypothetical protein